MLEWFTKQTFNHFTFTHLLNVIEQFQFQMCSHKPHGCPCEMLNSSITCCLFFNRQAECFIKPTKTNNNENTISLYTNLAQFALLLDMIIYEGNGVCSTCIERVHNYVILEYWTSGSRFNGTKCTRYIFHLGTYCMSHRD